MNAAPSASARSMSPIVAVRAQRRVHNQRRQRRHASAPEEHRKLRRPRFGFPAIDALEESDDDHEGDEGQQRRLHE